MAITKEFLKLFHDFVANYKRNGTPTLLSWTKEQKHLQISKYIDELQVIITQHQDVFHDLSIIEHLNSTVLLCAKTNPYLLECWIDFLQNYNNSTQTYTPLEKMHIEVRPEGSPSEKMLQELQNALISNIQASGLAQKVYSTETSMLKEQIAGLKTALKELSAHNNQLQQQIQDQTYLKSLLPQFNLVQTQLDEMKQLFTSIAKATSDKKITPELHSEIPVNSDKPVDESPVTSHSKSAPTLPNPAKTVENTSPKVIENLPNAPQADQNFKTSPPPPPPLSSKGLSTVTTKSPSEKAVVSVGLFGELEKAYIKREERLAAKALEDMNSQQTQPKVPEKKNGQAHLN